MILLTLLYCITLRVRQMMKWNWFCLEFGVCKLVLIFERDGGSQSFVASIFIGKGASENDMFVIVVFLGGVEVFSE